MNLTPRTSELHLLMRRVMLPSTESGFSFSCFQLKSHSSRGKRQKSSEGHCAHPCPVHLYQSIGPGRALRICDPSPALIICTESTWLLALLATPDVWGLILPYTPPMEPSGPHAVFLSFMLLHLDSTNSFSYGFSPFFLLQGPIKQCIGG